MGTLLRRTDPALRATSSAVLHLHGWNDYFFHPHVAEFYEQRGYAFHALDLRRYGRSLVPGQFRGYVADLNEYADEVDAALAVLRAEHEHVILTGHSTGGLTACLYAAERPGELSGLVLNSPWLDMWGPPAATPILRAVLDQWSRRSPTAVIPNPEMPENVYARAMHVNHGGEWDYNLEFKAEAPEPIRVGWLRGVLRGHARVAAGLGIDCPVLVTTSAKTVFMRRFRDDALSADIVLDVDRIMAAAWHLGDEITLVRIDGGTHDLTLSPRPARDRWFAAVGRWLEGYGPAAGTRQAPASDA